jgi:glycosyltransferase involved in cell wall biosynthesis
MTVSVAMCTWNGSAFVLEQLRSIVEQTRAVNEIVVCDDHSDDNTADLVHHFAQSSPVPVRLHRNEVNIGFRLNFSQAISFCRAEIILLSDQDDIWREDKVARMVEIFAARPDVDLLFSDAALVDDAMTPIGYGIWESIQFDDRRKSMVRNGRFLEVLMNRNVVTGATAGIRSHIRDLIVPVPGKWVHDAWIATLVAATGTAEFIEEPLIFYRQHSAQQVGGRKLSIAEQLAIARTMDAQFFLDVAADYEAVRERLLAFRGSIRRPGAVAMLQGKIDHSRFRARVRQNWRGSLPRLAGNLLTGKYHRYSLGLFSVLQDLLVGAARRAPSRPGT